MHTMVNLKLITVFLCTFSWISSSHTQFYTVEVQPGEDVTLQCSNFSKFPAHIYWFKMTNRPNASCISSMFSADVNASLSDGSQDSKFSTTSNTSVVFLTIKRPDSSDSGLYFCGEYSNGKPAISSGTYLEVQDAAHGLSNMPTVILSSLIVFLLLVIIGLVVKIKFHAAQDNGQNPQHSENVDSDATNYAALSFRPKAKVKRPVPQRELEANVVYAATR